MPDYQKGKIYKLVSDHTDEIYIGSTIQKLCARLGGHKRDFKRETLSCMSKKLFDLGKVKIVLIENIPCDSKEELYKRERHYIKTTDCVNKNMPSLTKEEKIEYKKEHYLKNIDKIKEQTKEYRLKNKDKIKERKKLRTICDCGLDVCKNDISKHKKTKKHMDLMESKTEVLIDASLQSLH